MSARGPLVVLLLVLAGGSLFTASGAGAPTRANAGATGFEREDLEGTRGLLSAQGDEQRQSEEVSVSASTANGRGVAEAATSVDDVEEWDGLLSAERVEVGARASSRGVRTTGRVIGLSIEGRRVGSPTRRHVYRLGRYGSVSVLASGPAGIAGLRATLSRPYGEHPAGSRITVAYASARASDEPPPTTSTSSTATSTTTEAPRPRRRASPRPSPQSSPAEPPAAPERPATPRRREAPELRALRTSRGYAFPVHRDFTYSDDWGAPRRYTATHEGNDIYARAGTPVLAVTSGTLYRVGTRKVPGNRLWLRSSRGDTFFYAHLSAFAESARNGARVRAGDVLGFVGDTGDAERTPPHLHFEVHPQAGAAVNPYPFLRAWDERRDVPAAAWLDRYGQDPGARPGVLVVVEDFLAR